MRRAHGVENLEFSGARGCPPTGRRRASSGSSSRSSTRSTRGDPALEDRREFGMHLKASEGRERRPEPVADPKVLFLDEPTSGLDSVSATCSRRCCGPSPRPTAHDRPSSTRRARPSPRSTGTLTGGRLFAAHADVEAYFGATLPTRMAKETLTPQTTFSSARRRRPADRRRAPRPSPPASPGTHDGLHKHGTAERLAAARRRRADHLRPSFRGAPPPRAHLQPD